MQKKLLAALLFLLSINIQAQKDTEDEKPKGFQKENLFTGGSVNLSFFNNSFIIGASPVFGYSVTNWADVAVLINYNYASQRDVYDINDRLRQYTYGGGAFVRLYPAKFLFAQGQVERNYVKEKYKPVNGNPPESVKSNAGSLLVGGGYCSGRQGRGGQPFYYVSVMFDISAKVSSPYTDNLGRAIPIIRGGFQIPLFQGGGRKNR
ncbi:MAG: hypothetical protein RL115_92 [Bacteroidota bacterium]|jgi:hypothetical protein